MLSAEERTRYDRHLILPEFGEAAQLKLKNAKVLVIGAGGLGCPALLYLAAAGVGTIGIVDGDNIEESNLQRQVLFGSEDIGKSKAEVAAEKLSKQNPFVSIDAIPEFLTTANAIVLFSEYDVILDGTDNFATRYLCNDAAVICNKPLIHGSIFKFEGQVSVFNYKNGSTYRCLFPEPPALGSVPSCSEIGVIGVLPGIIGNYQAMETIKVITGIGEPLTGKLLCINTLNNTQQILEFDRNETHASISELLESYEIFCGFNPLVKEISFKEAQILLNKENSQLIDVREADEFKNHNVGGKNLPLSTFETNQIHEGSTPIFICQKGGRSLKAAQLFSVGLNRKAFSVTGGIDGLSEEIAAL